MGFAPIAIRNFSKKQRILSVLICVSPSATRVGRNYTLEQFENIVGYPVTTQDRHECVDKIFSWIEAGERSKYFVCANPHSLEIARNDPVFREAILNADMIVPDGAGMVIASRILKGGITERVTGSDVFWGLSRRLNNTERRYKYFFLGSTEENLVRIQDMMKRDFPFIEVAGTFSPPFKQEYSPDENREMVEAVNNACINTMLGYWNSGIKGFREILDTDYTD